MQEHDRLPGGVRLGQNDGNRVPGKPGHVDVQKHEIRTLLNHRGDGAFTPRTEHHLVARCLEGRARHVEHDGAIVYNKNRFSGTFEHLDPVVALLVQGRQGNRLSPRMTLLTAELEAIIAVKFDI